MDIKILDPLKNIHPARYLMPYIPENRKKHQKYSRILLFLSKMIPQKGHFNTF